MIQFIFCFGLDDNIPVVDFLRHFIPHDFHGTDIRIGQTFTLSFYIGKIHDYLIEIYFSGGLGNIHNQEGMLPVNRLRIGIVRYIVKIFRAVPDAPYRFLEIHIFRLYVNDIADVDSKRFGKLLFHPDSLRTRNEFLALGNQHRTDIVFVDITDHGKIIGSVWIHLSGTMTDSVYAFYPFRILKHRNHGGIENVSLNIQILKIRIGKILVNRISLTG